MTRLTLWKACRATDNENIFSAARKFLIRLAQEMLRATDEPCFFFAVRVIMRRVMPCVNSHFGSLEPERHAYDGSAGAAESRRQVSNRASSIRKMRGEIPGKSPTDSGINPRKSPALSGINPRRSPGSSGIRRGSRTLSSLDLGIRSKNGFSKRTDRHESMIRHWLMLMRWSIAGRCRTSKSRNSRRTKFPGHPLLIPWACELPPVLMRVSCRG